VIIPNFGGFVANYAPSKFDDINNTITPPKKHLLFNKNLLNNDGLLAHRVSSVEDLPYDKALSVIEDFSRNLIKKLNSDKRVELSGIGILFSSKGQYRFKSEDTNFLISSFGLPVLSVVPLATISTTSNEEETPVINIQQQPTEKLNPAKRYWWVAAVLLPILFYTAWIPLKTNLLSDHSNFHYSDLNPFSFNKQNNYYKNNLVFCDNSQIPVAEKWEAENIESYYEKYPLDDNNSFVVVKLKDPLDQVPVTTFVDVPGDDIIAADKPIVNHSYYLVGGCFKKKSNADGFLNSLLEMGFPAVLIDKNKGLHRIGVSGCSSRKEAKKARKKILKERGISSWILKLK
jgi:hypothetical protein